MKRSIVIGLLFAVVLLGAAGIYLSAQHDEKGVSVDPRYANIDISGKVNAPEFKGEVGWLNVEKPLRIRDLRGKVVLLDFWTYCCINCIHIIPDLKRLEAKYPEELVVIGVHSAKFQNEKETENIRSAVLRYEIEHPVVNDANFSIWGEYGARGWPHMVIIDPEGKVVGSLSGEGNYEVLDSIISRLIAKFENRIDRTPIPLALEKEKEPPTVLAFPSKVLADEESGRIFISDSNHNRIIITDSLGKVLDIAGDGSMGLTDGSFDVAEFDHPQGMALVGDLLYVADTENHALRVLNLQERTVETVAGTGEQASWRSVGGPARTTKLNSPWDLVVRENDPLIYIAMAGPHQLWVYVPQQNVVEVFAGTGREDIIDGPLVEAALAQPSGLATDGQNLYFADSEVSALRMVDLAAGQVKTLIGTGLFDFGDRDGAFEQALLQHVLGVAYKDGKVYLADTYNHKIKVADLQSRTLSTFVGTGSPGVGSVTAPQFYEPGGIGIAGDLLYVADTNNNAVRVVNLNTKEVSTLNLDLSEWQMRNQQNVFEVFGNPQPVVLRDNPVQNEGEIQIEFQFPENFHFNPLAQPIVQLRVTGESGRQWTGSKFVPVVQGDTIAFSLEGNDAPDPQKVEVSVTYYYCRDDNQGQCMIGSALFELPVNPGNETVSLQHEVRIQTKT